jgi:ribosomal protein S18 acetylase RimI-like enzyme
MGDVRIEAYTSEMAEEASRVLAQAFATNPLHVATFGPMQVAKNEAFFRGGLMAMKGPMRVALDGSRIVGVVHWVRSPGCRFSGAERLRMMPVMMKAFGPRATLRVASWLGAWSKRHPRAEHGHLGPIGVSPEAQGRGVGRRLMDVYCDELDRDGIAGYLETDRPENVRFYRRFGFDVVAEAPVLGVPNFYMWRQPRAAAPAPSGAT